MRVRLSSLIFGALVIPISGVAELYISPVVRDTVSYEQPVESAPTDTPIPRELQDPDVKGTSSRHGQFSIASDPAEKNQDKPLAFGHNVPLFVAIEHVIPDAESWTINIDTLTEEDAPISWAGGSTWRDVLHSIEAENGVYFAVNESQRAIGVSGAQDIADSLAFPMPRAWRINSEMDLTQNLRAWLASINYTLIIDEDAKGYRHDMVSNALLRGDLFGAGGVIDRVVARTSETSQPLAAKAYHGDRVLLLSRAKYKSSFRHDQ